MGGLNRSFGRRAAVGSPPVTPNIIPGGARTGHPNAIRSASVRPFASDPKAFFAKDLERYLGVHGICFGHRPVASATGKGRTARQAKESSVELANEPPGFPKITERPPDELAIDVHSSSFAEPFEQQLEFL